MSEIKNLPSILEESQKKFELACADARSLRIVNNFGTAFSAVKIVALLREALTDDVMKAVFMPLMNTKVGFLTDRSGKPNSRGEVKDPYSVPIVRDAIIDAVSIGLLPTGNQMNIIADRMYPTKEGYTALLKQLGVKYFLDVSYDRGQNPHFAEIPVKVSYEYNGEKSSFTVPTTVKKDSYSSADQLRGKAERRAKKALYEYLTGCDFGDADETSSTVDAEFVEVGKKPNEKVSKIMDDLDAVKAKKEAQKQMTDQAKSLQTIKFKSEDEARIFMVEDNGVMPESVIGKLLYSTAEEMGIKIEIINQQGTLI